MRGLLTNSMSFDLPRDANNIPTAGTGRAKKTDHITSKRVQFAGAFTGWSVQLQGTVDGDNYINIGSAVTGAAIAELPEFWRFLRLVVNTAGAEALMSASLGGYTVGDHE